MFRCRRLHRSFILLSMAMSCFISGYLLGFQYERSYLRSIKTSRDDVKSSRGRRISSHDPAPNILDSNKLAKIARLLGVNAEPGDVNGVGYRQLQYQITKIEELLLKFRSLGQEKRRSDLLMELREILKEANEPKTLERSQEEDSQIARNVGQSTPTELQREHSKKSNDEFSVLENIEDILEQPPFPPPPIQNVKLNSMPYMTNVHHKPSTCVRYPRKSIWFMTRYIPNIKVFMDKEDINNFTNYYKLSHYRLPFGVKGQDRRLLGRLLNNPNLTNPDVLIDNESRRCVRCAVVGLGGVLNGSDMGRTIDRHDYVFRVNRALTKGRFAQDVGTRTSFYTFFPESQYAKDIQDPSVMPFYVIYRPYDIAYAMAMLGNDTPPLHTYDNGQTYWTPSKPKLDVRKLKIIHPDFMRYVFTRFLDSKANWPTTGALVAFLALHMCDEVNMYGFGYDSRFPLHYYDDEPVKLTRAAVGSHDVANERRLWQKLMNENILYVYNRTHA